MTTETRSHTVHVADVREALTRVVAANPGRTDRRIEDHLNPRYLDHGRPTCLVAEVLLELGFRITLLQALDRECHVGHVASAGVRIRDSRHPALKRLHPAARTLLQHLQSRQDRGVGWHDIAEHAFKPRSVWRLAKHDREARPWLY